MRNLKEHALFSLSKSRTQSESDMDLLCNLKPKNTLADSAISESVDLLPDSSLEIVVLESADSFDAAAWDSLRFAITALARAASTLDQYVSCLVILDDGYVLSAKVGIVVNFNHG